MSAFGYLLICFSILSIQLQNVSCQYNRKRNTFDPNIAAISYSEVDVLPYTDPYYTCPASYIPEQPYVSEYACPLNSRAWPEYRTPGPCGGNYAIQSSLVEETIVEEPVPASPPLITAVGFGGDALALALSPLLEAADADVALLMFTKVKSC